MHVIKGHVHHIIILFLVCVILFSFSSIVVTFSSDEYFIEIYGVVVDSLTRLPVCNATVVAFYYLHGRYIAHSILTDFDGHFNLSFSIPRSELYYVKPTLFVGVFYDSHYSPGFDYIPQLKRLKLLLGEEKLSFQCNFSLYPAASIKVFNQFLYVNFSKPADKLRFLVVFPNGSLFKFENSISTYGELDDSAILFLLQYMGLSSNEIVVPAYSPFNVIIEGMFAESFYVPVTSWWRRRIVRYVMYKQVDLPLFDDVVEVESGFAYNVSILEVTLKSSRKIVERLFDLARVEVDMARNDGFYVASIDNRLAEISQFIDEAKVFFRDGKYLPCYSALREAYLALDNIISYVKWMRSEVNYSAVSLIVFFSISSFALALIITEKDYLKPLFSAFLSLFFLYLLLTSYPKFHFENSLYFVVLFPSIILILSAFLSKFISFGSIFPLISNFFELFSVAKRNLRRRKIRTLALLISLVIFTFGSVALTSFSSEVNVLTNERPNEFGVIGLSFEKMFPPNFIVHGFSDVEAEFNPYGLPPENKILDVINSTGGVSGLTARAESRAKVRPSGALVPVHNPLNRLNVYGIVAFSSSIDPVYMKLTNFLIEGSMPIDEDDIVISVKAAKSLGVAIGDRVVFNGKVYEIVGLLDDQKLFHAREISGRPLLPYKMFLSLKGEDGHPSIYESEVCLPEEVVFMAWSEIERLGLSPTRFFLYTNMSDIDLLSAARAAALSGGEHVITALMSEKSLNMALIEYTEFKGYEALIPVLLIIFNAAITAQASLHERRREILTFSAVGCSPSRLFMIFLYEAFLIGFAGGALGYALGLSSYKLMAMMSSIDVKPKISFVWAIVSMSIAIVSMIIGAALTLRSSLLIVPSRLWHIKAIQSAERREDYWLFEIPVRIKYENVEEFMDFIYRELKSYPSSLEEFLRVISFKRDVIDGEKILTIVFIYDTGAGSASRNTARGIIELKVSDGECEIYLKVKSYGRDPENHAYKTARLVRNLALKWR